MPHPNASVALTSAAAARNRQSILAVFESRLPDAAFVLEIASGTGEHAVHIAYGRPKLVWQPTDTDDVALASIAAWRDAAGLANVLAPLRLDAADPLGWPVERADVIVAINMIHIAPWAAARGLVEGAGRLLPEGGVLFFYGPYIEADVETAPSNIEFDRSLRSRDPAWGIRHLDEVRALAARHGLALVERIAMPANNLTLLFRKVGHGSLEPNVSRP